MNFLMICAILVLQVFPRKNVLETSGLQDCEACILEHIVATDTIHEPELSRSALRGRCRTEIEKIPVGRECASVHGTGV